jgi:hypothetical protein
MSSKTINKFREQEYQRQILTERIKLDGRVKATLSADERANAIRNRREARQSAEAEAVTEKSERVSRILTD